MFNKVLVLSATAGAGHLRAAQALEKAFLQLNAAREVRHIDTLAYTNPLFRKLYADAYLQAAKSAPTVLGWLYDRLDRPDRNHPLTHAFNKLNTRPFVKLLEQYQPDIAVCTHFLPSEIIGRLKQKQRLHCPLAVTITDFDAHAMWLCPGDAHFFVAIPETAVHLQQLGFPASNVSVTGIPIDPIFAQPKDQRAMRLKYGLHPDRTTILVATGGFGVGSIENLMTALQMLRHPAQIIAICGRNQKLQNRLEKLHATVPPTVPTHLVGYTQNMDEYMSAADILVGKPGGLTTSEALVKGLVLCIVNPIPGQEERNSDHLLEQGAALRCNNLPVLAWKLDQLLDDPARLARLRRNAQRLACPDAACTIVRQLLEIAPQFTSV